MEIPLIGGHIAIVDDDDGWVAQYRWYALRKPCGTIYARGRMTGRALVLMHRAILAHHGIRLGRETDHVNLNGLDNRKGNLRPATTSQNHANGCKRAGSSIYKGVTWNKRDEKWEACAKVDRHTIHLGYFADEREAARAYDLAAIEHFGEFARLNNV